MIWVGDGETQLKKKVADCRSQQTCLISDIPYQIQLEPTNWTWIASVELEFSWLHLAFVFPHLYKDTYPIAID